MARREYTTTYRCAEPGCREHRYGVHDTRREADEAAKDQRDRCWDCRLPDPYNGTGDGIGSCECSRCEHCGGRPLRCNCSDYDEEYWEEHGSEDSVA